MAINMPDVQPVQQTPLAVRLRPTRLDQVVGQAHLVGQDGILNKMVQRNNLQNIILWGPPGSGKTSVAFAIVNQLNIRHVKLNATFSGVKELKDAIKLADDGGMVVIVDEIHRWAKNVQDVLLHAIENNIITLIGITVEKAQFAVNKAIISRCLVLETTAVSSNDLLVLYKRIEQHYKSLNRNIVINKKSLAQLIIKCNGDARKLMLVFETLMDVLCDDGIISDNAISTVLPHKYMFFDATGNEHFDYAHCYQEAIQHSDADGAIYWLAKWIKSGEDPAYICRRMLITAFEDCSGNPFAPIIAMAASYTTERTGLPECAIAMSLATCEMARSTRNKSAYWAIKNAMDDVENNTSIDVPPELRAGTDGWFDVVKKKYLKGWRRDASMLSPD